MMSHLKLKDSLNWKGFNKENYAHQKGDEEVYKE